MNVEELNALGFPTSTHSLVYPHLKRMSSQGLASKTMGEALKRVADHPHNYLADQHFGQLAKALLSRRQTEFHERRELAPWKKWGHKLEEGAVNQMRQACRLPVAVAGALMPDAHLGYGLPIGGVLATKGAVIPYAVGVDIACRMKLTVLDLPTSYLGKEEDTLTSALEEETRFGMGASFSRSRQHQVLDDGDWRALDITRSNFEKARSQLGTSGSGNHFVEFGELVVEEPQLGLQPGKYVALLSHSGSRGPGSAVAERYSALAMELHPELPKELQHLAWLDLDSEEGQEYWLAMQLMGRFAAANHEVIHRELARHLGAEVLAGVENHHNFAWKESHGGQEVVVHRKGATPAGEGVLGIIPGSMASPAFVVRGKGNAESLESASHGAGRVMSRSQALKTFSWEEVNRQLKRAGVTLLSSGLDEVPGVYKNIHQVMAAQSDLVEVLATFHPRLVKMAPPGRPKGRRRP
jgi:tRNA-splicing ligase RtcB